MIIAKYRTAAFLFAGMAILCSDSSLLSTENSAASELHGLKVTGIEITAQRVNTETIRKVIPLKVGDTFKPEDLESIRVRLNSMKFFKKIDISAVKDAKENGVRVLIQLVDGWFVFPLPLLYGGSGGQGGSLMLIERNIFKQAESIFLFGGGNSDGGFGSAGLQYDHFSFAGNFAKRKSAEWTYADGGVNTSGRMKSSRTENDPGKFGPIRDQYEKEMEEAGLQVRFPINNSFNGSAGFLSQKLSYTGLVSGAAPSDRGNVNSISAGLNYSFSRPENMRSSAGGSFSFQDFGAVFGFGMADLSERIKPLSRVQTNTNVELSISESDRSFGSDFNFAKLTLGISPAVTFKHRQRIALRVRGIAGLRENLPFSQKVAANRELGLRGNYAREYRGDRGVGTSANISYPFRRTQRGVWTGEIFADAASVWDSGRSFDKEGVGFGFGYQFWRFPIPLGFTYSHSLDDRDSQVNFAFGGRF